MYEVEFKVELNLAEKNKLIEQLKISGFEFKGLTPQNDYYIKASKSEYGGYDLLRYRNEADKYIYTEKIWEIIDDQKARKENEHEVTKTEFDSAVQQFPMAIKVIKDREWFVGEYNGKNISVTIDSVKFDHSPEMRYFVEAEIDVENSNEVAATKVLIQDFLKFILHKSELIDSPGMFMMAFEKR
jgi:predicted adenylyl cyclase CyaB